MSKEIQIKDQLKRTMGYQLYNGWENSRTTYGYHSFNLEGIDIQGQRTPKLRLNEFKKHVSFKDKIVVDIGCNVGGMLFHIPDLKKGYGFDYDDKCIVAANNIANILDRKELLFSTIDLDKVPHNSLMNYINEKIDIVFLLSLGKWISTHNDLYKFFVKQGADIILELNNNRKDKKQLEVFKELGLEPKLIIEGSPDDNTEDNKSYRATYFIKNDYTFKT